MARKPRISKMHDEACKLVVEYERKHGRRARDVSHDWKGYDIKGERLIEVKVTKGLLRSRSYSFTQSSWEEFRIHKNSWLYIIISWGRSPRLLKIHRDSIWADKINIPAPSILIRFRKEHEEELMKESEFI